MADIKLSYPEVPEVFSNGTRMKGVYNNGELVWPKRIDGTIEYPITFNANGGVVETSFDSGWEWTVYNKLETLPIATHASNTFLGWALNASADTPTVSTNSSFWGEATVYAVWQVPTVDPDTPDPDIPVDPDTPIDPSDYYYLIAEYFATADSADRDAVYQIACMENGNGLQLVAKAPSRGEYVVEDATGALLIYARNEAREAFNSQQRGDFVRYGLMGNCRVYDGTTELVVTQSPEFLDGSGPPEFVPIVVDEIFSGDGDSLWGLGSIEFDIMDGGSRQCCQPLGLRVAYGVEQGNCNFSFDNEGYEIIVNFISGRRITLLFEDNPEILNAYLVEGFIIEFRGYLIYWEGHNERYSTMIVNNAFDENGRDLLNG